MLSPKFPNGTNTCFLIKKNTGKSLFLEVGGEKSLASVLNIGEKTI